MVVHRKPTVLTPKPERASRAKPKVIHEDEMIVRPGGAMWRSRPTLADPFTDELPKAFEGTEEEVRARHASDTAAGLAPLVEVRTLASWGAEPREVITVLDLAKMGHAHEVHDKPGVYRITPEGERILRESMMPRG